MRVSRPIRCSSLIATLFLVLGLVACRGGGSSGSSTTTPPVTPPTHATGYLSTHQGAALSSLNSCKTCHGQDLAGGTSKISCATAACHHNTLPNYALPGSHGLRAKLAQGSSGGGLASCQICHGSTFATSLTASNGASKSCTGCHGVAAPHPAKPWNTTASNHATTDPSSAAVCGQCHYPGATANPAGHPAVAAPAGTAPGCYNNTLCHGDTQAPHALGAAWRDATSTAFHGLEAKKDLVACQACHGTTGTPKFDGNPLSTTKCTTCHVQAKAHPTVWNGAANVAFPGFVSSHRNALKMGTTCTVCHDFTRGRTAPDPAAPSCFSASANSVACHVNGPGATVHAVPFLAAAHTAATQATFNADCAACHAVSGASPSSTAPACAACHQGGSPLTQMNCASCHAKPPTGSAFPNIAGGHAKHDALAAVTGLCGTCHQGSDSGSLAHYSAADGRTGHDSLRTFPGQVAFVTTFNANTGAATFNAAAQTCSNVSCHGGQTTPRWATTGSINVATDCTACHTVGTAAGVPQANSAYSGVHALHMSSPTGLQCVECHAMANGSTGALNHFTQLTTAAMEGPANQTVAFTGGSYNSFFRSCTVTCHGKVHTALNWSGVGSVHPAGWTASHPAGALANLTSCKTCHGQDLAGGFSQVSCATAACHHNTVPNYVLPGSHGARAKVAQTTTGGGLASCQVCHGSTFTTPLTASDGTRKACTTCHGVAAPHPAKPWRSSAGSVLSHTTTDASNAVACAQCHFPGAVANPFAHPATPAPAGTAPGCFNNTLCHGAEAAPHAMGAIWKDATSGAFHGLQAKKDLASCQSCHGTPGTTSFTGGVGASTGCATCHTQAKAHANVWNAAPGAFPGYVASHRDSGNRDASCSICHDFTKGRTAPDVLAPSCYAASANSVACHVNGPGAPNHSVPFLTTLHTAATATTFSADCATCHAVSGTSPISLAPLCSACHQGGSPLTQTNCTSCHAKPPVGTTFPDIAGGHAKHDALATVTGVCGTCHQGSDSGSLAHYDAANGRAGKDGKRVFPGQVSFLTGFSASGGTAAFNATAQTCSNVSCHGGQTTPSWATGGSINVATDCTACHTVGTSAGVPQANSPYSGFHALHMSSRAGLQCTECHAMSNGSTGALNHLKTLNTAQMEGPANQTVALAGGTYNAAAMTCTVTCHGKVHTSYTWGGTGGVHPAGWGTSHPGSALADLNACKTCHGTTLQGGAWNEPSCSTAACHHNTLPGYALPGSHGLRAKLAQGSTGGGLASCQVCHGSTFATPLTATDGTSKACTTCHGVAAPHPVKPWRTSAGTALSHTTVDVSNAAVCAQCHYPGAAANPFGHPAVPAPTGTAPGCFNNTLCHGPEAAPHALGTIWKDATSGAFHGLQAKKDLASCQTCHGTPGTTSFAGGPNASTSCATCHTQAKAHANVWNAAPGAFPSYVASHRDSGNRDVACAICHDGTKGRTPPLTAAPSCFSDSVSGVACHVNGPGQPNHAIPFLGTAHTAATQPAFDANCGLCHGITGTSPVATAPLCTACHQAGSPLTQANCTSCHAKPPTGGAFPNVAGSHAKHDALANVTGACAACHQGSEAGSQTHYDHANGRAGKDSLRVSPGEVASDPAYNSKAGTAAFNPTLFTCSNVSCHGGQTTPNWLTGTIASNTEAGCRSCHVLGSASGLPESNSPYSGLHALHLNSTQNLQCVECHAMANGTTGAQNHFKFLNTAQMEGPAGQTVAFSTATGTALYDIASQSCGSGGAFSCHGHAHPSSYTWKGGGASHAVPFADTGHTGVNSQISFDGNCKNCHSVTGTSPLSSAPLCTTCHQAGSPLIQASCTSCHSKPPVGSAFPDVAGKHFKHNALTGITAQCSTCHSNADSGTSTHYDHANAIPGKDSLRLEPGVVSVLASVNGKSGSASFDSVAMTCSNISCHGGLTTPSWRTGSIAINTDAGCKSCHSAGTAPGVPENNSAYSGLHSLHLGSNVNAQCIECHNMANGSVGANNHFTSLTTSQMAAASGTIALTGGTYTVATQACTVTCHNQAHINFPWAGGANHVVPYQSPAHTAVDLTTFNANCKVCHAETGATSPMSTAPSCTACHQAGSPFSLLTCSSCHAKPPTGASFPNVAGNHAVHNALTGVTGQCSACHTGSDSGSTTHYNHANGRPGLNSLRVAPGEVGFPAAPATTYNAKSGTATWSASARTCSNVSCHGGQTTPVWGTGTIDITTSAGCKSCHAYGTGQYNSYNSGEHNLHAVSKGYACTECHRMANGSAGANAHLTTLGTSAMEGAAKDTVTFDRTVVTGTTITYTVSGTTKTCTLTCHSKSHSNFRW